MFKEIYRNVIKEGDVVSITLADQDAEVTGTIVKILKKNDKGVLVKVKNENSPEGQECEGYVKYVFRDGCIEYGTM